MNVKEIRCLYEDISHYGYFENKVRNTDGVIDFKQLAKEVRVYDGLTNFYTGGKDYDFYTYLSPEKPNNLYILATTGIACGDEFTEEALIFVLGRNDDYTITDIIERIREYHKANE